LIPEPVVLVLDSNQRSALAATRSLGEYGLAVANGDTTEKTLAGASNCSREQFVYPDPRRQPEEFVSVIRDKVASLKDVTLLPVTDLTTNIILRNRDKLLHAKIPFGDVEVFDSLTNKSRLLELARKNDLTVPESELLTSTSAAADKGRRLGYPLVVKPTCSEYFSDGTWKNSQVSIVDSEPEMLSCLKSNFEAGIQAVLLQEFIPGHGAGIFALYDQGKAVGFYAHHRVREKPPSGGVSVVSESVAPDESILESSKKLLDSAGWHGAAMIEFRRSHSGKQYVMEVNGRLWGSLQLGISAGFDVPVLLYQVQAGIDYTIPSVITGVRNRWLLGDVDHFLLSCRNRFRSDAQSPSYAKLIREFLNLNRKPQNFEVLRRKDIRPFLLEFRRYVIDLVASKS
jgi:predicted ATP-grasp superfamily ATP-dependent carboligase